MPTYTQSLGLDLKLLHEFFYGSRTDLDKYLMQEKARQVKSHLSKHPISLPRTILHHYSHAQAAAAAVRDLEYKSRIEVLNYIDASHIQWHQGLGSLLGSGGFA